MSSKEPFLPANIYHAEPPIRAITAPPKYLQGQGVMDRCGPIAQMHGCQKVGLLASARGLGSQGVEITASLEACSVEVVSSEFQGECSEAEIGARVLDLAQAEIDCLIAVGGGKCVDAGKCIAARLDVPLIVVPTLASNDAPCSAVSVLYTPEGVVCGAEFFPMNPLAVIVDTAVIVRAPERYLVAGMGDALATWYEARVCRANPAARSVLGARPTLAASTYGKLCADTIFAQGTAAARAVREGVVNEALEDVVEANTLHSGIGFESGGLAGAHGYAQGYTVLPEVEHAHLHGEMVGMGILAQLMLEDDLGEAKKVAQFFVSIGLPVELRQMGLSADQDDAIDAIVAGALEFAPINNLPFAVNKENVKAALLAADKVGIETTSEFGEEAYLRCMSNA